jgi:ubiquinone/menaquinone biosynthesis C-methylase UbiE
LKEQGIELITVDIDANLNPDIVASIDKLPFLDNTFEVAIACQILEHIP